MTSSEYLHLAISATLLATTSLGAFFSVARLLKKRPLPGSSESKEFVPGALSELFRQTLYFEDEYTRQRRRRKSKLQLRLLKLIALAMVASTMAALWVKVELKNMLHIDKH